MADSLTNSAAASVETAGGNTLNQELVKASLHSAKECNHSDKFECFILPSAKDRNYREVKTKEGKGSHVFMTLSRSTFLGAEKMALYGRTCC